MLPPCRLSRTRRLITSPDSGFAGPQPNIHEFGGCVLVGAYKTIRFANVLGSWTRGVIVNRAGKAADLTTSEVEQFMDRTLGSMPILSEIPDDPKV